MPVGLALTRAKKQYLGEAATGGFGTYDEKVMIESTLYGLPMYRVSVPDPAPRTDLAETGRVTESSAGTLKIAPDQGVHLDHRTLESLPAVRSNVQRGTFGREVVGLPG